MGSSILRKNEDGISTSHNHSASSSLQRSSNNNNNKRTQRRGVTHGCCGGGAVAWNVVCIFMVAIGCIISLTRQQQSLGKQGLDLSHYYHSYYDSIFTTRQHGQGQEASPLPCINTADDDGTTAASVASSICRQLTGRGTAASLWMTHRDEILKASRHPLDLKHQHDAWTRALFDLLTIHRPVHNLQRAWRTMPRPEHVNRIIAIVQRRMAFLAQQQLDNPGHAGKDPPGAAPPLKIAIFGGSVTEGTKCEWLPNVIVENFASNTNGTTTTWPSEIKGNVCAWPFRWQRLLDHFLGPRVVQVYNLAVGGTSSRLALPILKYWLYPRDSDLGSAGPDIILNAYAANDNLFSWDHNANGTTTMDNFYHALQSTEAFCRTALLSQPCHAAPILGFVSEYQGNLNELLLAEGARADTVRLLSDYYGFFDLSPATVVRQLVLVNADETLLSPSWYNPARRRQPKNAPLERTKDSHYGMPGHVYTAWTMAYAALSMVLDHCDDINDEEDNQGFDVMEQANEAAIVALAMNRFPPPLVTRDLMTIDHSASIQETSDDHSSGIPMKWRQQAMAAQQEEDEYCRTSSTTQSPCPFVFVATPTGTARTKIALNEYIRRFRVNQSRAGGEGWEGENNLRYGWQNKIGLVASRPGGTLHLRLANIQQKIRHVIIQSMKSYGDEWKDSEAQFNITISNDANTTRQHGDDVAEKTTTSFTIQGFHDMNASIAVPFALDLGNKSAAIGQTVDVKLTLIGGKKFKIIAMMLCSR
jgi:hypothetical protein